jgi:hypothetical protein
MAKIYTVINYETLDDILGRILEKEYPDELVELGENWELIATIFYLIGKGELK